MKKSHKATEKSPSISKGSGTVTSDMVKERAREIALINGRLPNHYNQDDFMEAKRELTGDNRRGRRRRRRRTSLAGPGHVG